MSGTYTNLLYHIVFSTKHRAPLITSALGPDLHAFLVASSASTKALR
jgi:hypothetical protein